MQRHLDAYATYDRKTFDALRKENKLFCSAYHGFLSKLVENMPTYPSRVKSEHVIYHLGESHCLSYAYQILKMNNRKFSIIPMITFGAKAYHFSKKTDNRFKSITQKIFGIPKNSKVLCLLKKLTVVHWKVS